MNYNKTGFINRNFKIKLNIRFQKVDSHLRLVILIHRLK